jgi:hypothetical protein
MNSLSDRAVVRGEPQEGDVLIEQVRDVALRYKAKTGKPLGVTGELGELVAAEALNLELAPARQAGWDAKDALGRRLQIKTRACNRTGMMASINLKHEFDAVLLVILIPETLQLDGIYEMSRSEVEAGLARPGARARNERNALAVPWFISNRRNLAQSAKPANDFLGR